MGKQWKQTDLLFLGSKITENGDSRLEIKRYLLFGRKTMTNLDSILKRRDNTLHKNVPLVKTMVFPVVIYGCESWTICFWTVVQEKTFKESFYSKRIKPANSNGNQPWIFIGRTNADADAEAESPILWHLMGRVDSLKKTLMVGKIEGYIVLSFSVVSHSLQPHGLQPIRLLSPWGFSRQEYWSGLPWPPPENLHNPGIEPKSPALQADSLLSEPPEKPMNTRVGNLSLLHGIFPTQKLNQGLLHYRWILYQLNYQGSPITCCLFYIYFRLWKWC